MSALNWFGRLLRHIFSWGHAGVQSTTDLADAEQRLRQLEARARVAQRHQ
jgi:hypothetical protein